MKAKAFLGPIGAESSTKTTENTNNNAVKRVLATKELLDKNGKKIGEKEVIFPADLVVLAMGFTGAERVTVGKSIHVSAAVAQKSANILEFAEGTSASAVVKEIEKSSGGAAKPQVSPMDNYWLGKNLFGAGDCRRGASLVVTAIAEGRDVANR